MAMPEAAVDKNHRPPFRQDNIRLSRQILHIQTKPETGGVQHLPDRDLRRPILTVNPAHIPRSLCLVEMIGHLLLF